MGKWMFQTQLLIMLCWLVPSSYAVSQDWPTGYDLVFAEAPDWQELAKSRKPHAELLSNVRNDKLGYKEQCSAAVALALTTPAEKIPWEDLASCCDAPEIHEAVAAWCAIAAGKRLSNGDRIPGLEKWLFGNLRRTDNSGATVGGIFALGILGMEKNAVLREWSRLLRDENTPESICYVICEKGRAIGALFGKISDDEMMNMFLSGYDERNASPSRKEMLIKSMGVISSPEPISETYRGAGDWCFKQLMLREFIDEKNSDSVRWWALHELSYPLETDSRLDAAARKIIDTREANDQLKVNAIRYINMSEKESAEEPVKP